MKWEGKNIDELSEAELEEARIKINDMHDKHIATQNSPQYRYTFGSKNKKVPRGNNPPINPIFLELKKELDQEYNNRKGIMQ